MGTTRAEIANELYADKPTDLLYHYTSLGGLMGIVKERALHATEVHYVSDASEVRLIAHLLRSAAGVLTNYDEFGRHLFGQLLDWVDNRVTELGHALFVGCFTAKGNLLSQWRSYSEPGRGISVGFDPNKLARAAADQSWQVGKCVYDAARQRSLAASMLASIAELARERFDSIRGLTPNAAQQYFVSIEADILRIAVLFKHHAFGEEHEWRVVSPITSDFVATEGIGFREGRSMLVPYRKFALLSARDNPKSYLEHVWMGPTPHVLASISAINNYLSRESALPVRGVSYCGIPYRSW
jgi:hypothetical protein